MLQYSTVNYRPCPWNHPIYSRLEFHTVRPSDHGRIWTETRVRWLSVRYLWGNPPTPLEHTYHSESISKDEVEVSVCNGRYKKHYLSINNPHNYSVFLFNQLYLTFSLIYKSFIKWLFWIKWSLIKDMDSAFKKKIISLYEVFYWLKKPTL